MPNINPARQPNSSADETSELEVAMDLNDFDLDFSSGSRIDQQAGAESSDSSMPSSGVLSIDDFEFASSSLPPAAQAVVQTKDHWYTSVLGQELGPFPFDRLVQMVSEGEVGKDDLIRHGSDRPWIKAGDIEGLFPEEVVVGGDLESYDEVRPVGEDGDDGDFELKMVDDESGVRGPVLGDGVGFQAIGGEINRTVSHRPSPAAPGFSSPASPPVSPRSGYFPPSEPRVISVSEKPEKKPAKPQDTRTPEEKEADRKREIASRLNSWLEEKVPTPDPPATPEPAVVETPVSAPVSGWNQQSSAGAGAEYGYGGGASGGYGGGNPYATGQAAPMSRPQAPVIRKGSSSSRSGGSLFQNFSMPELNIDPKALGAIGVLGLVLLFMYFPSSAIFGSGDMKTYRRLQEISSQVERAKATDPGSLSSLGRALIPEVNEITTQLEKQGAGASKPIKQQLFFAGKYCLIPMLEGGGGEGEILEVNLKNYMDTAGRLLKDPNVPPLPPPDPNAPISNEDEDYEGA